MAGKRGTTGGAARAHDPAGLERWAPALAWALAALYCGVAWAFVAGGVALVPDTAHYAVLARNLASGQGYVVDYVAYHLGLVDSIRQVPVDHALLRPAVLAVLFRMFGEREALLCVPGIAYSALTGVVAFHFARVHFGTQAGLLACVVTLANGAALLWGILGADDLGFAFYGLLALFLLDRALARGSSRSFLLAGAVAALGLLEKLSGVIFLPLLVIALVFLDRSDARARLRRGLAWCAPFLLAFGAYVARNVLASGEGGFHATALEWVYRTEGLEAMFALHVEPPGLASLVGELGPSGLAGVALAQLRTLWDALWIVSPWYFGAGLSSPVLLLPLGALSLALQVRTHPRFAVLGLLAGVGSVALVCVFYHVEARYFALLAPIAATSLAGLCLGERRRGFARGLGRVAAVALAGVCLVSFAGTFQAQRGRGARSVERLCEDAYAWLGANTRPGEPVLSMYPYFVGWKARRPAVVIPSGGMAPLREVARHYGVRWLVVEPAPHRRETGRFLRRLAAGAPWAPGLRTAYAGGHCQVLDLGGRGGASGGRPDPSPPSPG